MQPHERYTYEAAGFNRFLLRSLKANPYADTLKGGISAGSGKPIAFDRHQMDGSLGDSIAIGNIKLNGADGNIVFEDESDERAILGFE